MKNDKSQQIFDELLILGAQQNDTKSVNLLIKRWQDRLLMHAMMIVQDRSLAQDIVQESWMAILKNINKLNNLAHFRPWVYRIVYNKSMDSFRKKKKHDHDIPEIYESEKTEDPRINRILRELSKLKAKDKNLVTLFYLEEMSIVEIAYIMKVPPGTIKSRLFHARNKLKSKLKLIANEK